MMLNEVFPSGECRRAPHRDTPALPAEPTCVSYGRVLVCPVEAGARQQREPATVQAGVHAMAIVLDLMQPYRALRRRLYQFAKLWLNPTWKSGGIAPRPIIHRFRHHSFGIKLAARYPE